MLSHQIKAKSRLQIYTKGCHVIEYFQDYSDLMNTVNDEGIPS